MHYQQNTKKELFVLWCAVNLTAQLSGSANLHIYGVFLIPYRGRGTAANTNTLITHNVWNFSILSIKLTNKIISK
jgi:hypothetical protein